MGFSKVEKTTQAVNIQINRDRSEMRSALGSKNPYQSRCKAMEFECNG